MKEKIIVKPRFREEGDEEAQSLKAIKDLIDTKWSGSNEDQGKAVNLLKGLAFSDTDTSNEFMKKLDSFTSGLDADSFKEGCKKGGGKKKDLKEGITISINNKDSAYDAIYEAMSYLVSLGINKVVTATGVNLALISGAIDGSIQASGDQEHGENVVIVIGKKIIKDLNDYVEPR